MEPFTQTALRGIQKYSNIRSNRWCSRETVSEFRYSAVRYGVTVPAYSYGHRVGTEDCAASAWIGLMSPLSWIFWGMIVLSQTWVLEP